MDVVLVLEFTRELSEVPPRRSPPRCCSTAWPPGGGGGENFRFGHKAAGDPALLAELGRPRGVEVVAVGLHADGDQVVSSTRVRGELATGDVAAAAASLGRPRRGRGGRGRPPRPAPCWACRPTWPCPPASPSPPTASTPAT